MKNKIVSIVLILIMAMVFSPVVHAENKPTGAEWLVDKGENHVWYKLTENTPTTNPVSYTLIIGGSGAMPDWDSVADTKKPLSYLNTPWRDIDNHYFKNITKIEIKEGITKIGNNSFSLAKSSTFSDTSTIEEVVLPESLKSIGSNAFKLNTTLESIKFPSKLDDIGYAAFQGCGLKEVALPESLETLGMAVFWNSESLEKVTLPSKLNSIGTQAFSGCTSLKNVISYNQNAPTLVADTFKNVSIKNLTILNDSHNSYKTNWNIDENYTNIIYLYKITVETNDENMGSAFASEKIALQDTLINLTAIPNNGYRFVKWESTDVNESMGQFNMPNSNVTIKAIFEIDNYNIIFNSNGGTAVESKQVSNGNKLIKPTDPTKENFVFDGWYIDEEFNEQFDFNTPITKDITLYAKCREVESFTYKFINGNNQELTIDDIKSFVLKVDGDYSLFKNLKIGNLDLIKDEDYTVTEGSTVITFTDKGIAKLNTLSKGNHEILVTYTNNKEVKGKLTIKQIVTPEPEIENPQTGDNYTTYLITGIISLISIIGISFYTREKLVR